ncbi:predicted lipase [Moesziomyces antarcticus T-34]|uniref:sn-1-specific diacylglycerol lipase n=1 Tax=Pseudozyma antarctica (strain T-34) TaxID=1151754 RepID=M9LSD7_PSEA3|nr:predicted lipase [Moesziomyces antarcticus T-34]
MNPQPPGSFDGVNEPVEPIRTPAEAQSVPVQEPLSPQEKQEVEEERQEAASLNEAALSIPDSEADDDAASTYEPANEAVPGDAGVVVGGGNPVDWQGVLGHSASGLGAANAATSAYFNFARTATAFGLNVAKRVTQGLVAVPALLADGALTGTAPGDTSGTPSIAQVAHSGIASFFDTISLVAVGGIDLTSAVTSAGLGAASSGVEGVRRSLGSEVLRSLLEFSKLVKREWNAEDDSLPPGGIPAYSIVGLIKALTTWVSIQLVTRKFQETRIQQGLDEIDTDKLKSDVEALKQTHHVNVTAAPLVPITAGGQAEQSADAAQSGQSDVRITSNQTLSGDAGSVIGAEIGHRDGSSARLPGSTLSDEPARPLSDAEAVHNLQRYSKLVLGVYGGMALYWLNSMPQGGQSTSGQINAPAPSANGVIFSAEDELMRKDQAEFLEAAAQMELSDDEDDGDAATPPQAAAAATNGHASSYNLWDVISGTHDEDLFHHTANLERGAAAHGQYDEDHASASQHSPHNPNQKARPSKPRFYVVTDHPRKTIILVLRGTLSVGDVAADLTCESVAFRFDASVQAGIDKAVTATEAEAPGRRGIFVDDAVQDLCHEGMYITAQEIGAPGRAVHRSVGAALAANPGYSIDITGHSLGAGVASVLAMMWADPTTGLTTASSRLPAGRRLHAYCFAVPCVTSAALGKKVSSIITSFTYSYDLVCRLSLGSIQDIRNGSAWLCYQDKMAAHGDGTMNALMKRAFEYQSGRMQEVASKETEHEMLVLRKTLEANMHNTHLFPPGKVLYALTSGADLLAEEGETHKKQRLFRVKDDKEALKKVFGQIIFSRNMLSCHMPNVYDARLHDITR